MKKSLFTLLIIGACLTGTSAQLFVDANVAASGDGSSWGQAYRYLQDALDEACNAGGNVEIWVAQGTYYPDEGANQTSGARSSTFEICPGVSLYGGFKGNAPMGMEALRSQADPTANKTVLSGDIGVPNDDSDNITQLVSMEDVGTGVVFDGFTVEKGNASLSGLAGTPTGGGIFIRAASFGVETSPTISRCVIRNNAALSQGGGVYVTIAGGTANVSIVSCVFEDNDAPLGGALYLNVNDGFGSSTVVNSVFYNNTGELGGGIHVFTGAASITNSTFLGNSVEDKAFVTPVAPTGSAIHNRGAVVDIRNSIIWGNQNSQITNEPNIFDATLNIDNSIVQGGEMGINQLPGTSININDPLPIGTVNYDAATNKDLNPEFVDDASPLGADNCWRTADDGLALSASSPAIDMGDDGFISETTDVTGAARSTDAAVDMGAYEFQGTTVFFTLSGNITWEHDLTTPVPGATVSLTGDDMANDNTDANGDYAIPTTGGNSLTLTPEKMDLPYQGVDVADVTRIQQHVTFIDRLDDGYKAIAADVNQSNSVTGLDAAVLFHAINGNPNAAAIFEDPSWRFVDSTHSFMDENAPWPFPEDISLMNVMADVLNQSFVGVKMGDVNGTWATPMPLLLAPALNWVIPDAALKAGQTLRVPFRANGLPDVAAWQFALRFDTDYLRFERALPTAAFPLKDENFGAWQADAGELRSVFAVPQGLVLPKEETVFELEFQVVRSSLRLSEVLRLDNGILDGRVYNTALNGGAVALAFDAVETRRIASLLPGEAALGFALEQNIPNPFGNETLVRFELPEAGEAVFSVHDVQGRLLYEQRGFLDAGQHEVRLDATRLGATGVLSYTLRSGKHSATRRMVLVR